MRYQLVPQSLRTRTRTWARLGSTTRTRTWARLGTIRPHHLPLQPAAPASGHIARIACAVQLVPIQGRGYLSWYQLEVVLLRQESAITIARSEPVRLSPGAAAWEWEQHPALQAARAALTQRLLRAGWQLVAHERAAVGVLLPCFDRPAAELSAIREAAPQSGGERWRWAHRHLNAGAASRTVRAALLSISVAGVMGVGTLSQVHDPWLPAEPTVRIIALAPAGATMGHAMLAPEDGETAARASSGPDPRYAATSSATAARPPSATVRLRRLFSGSAAAAAHLSPQERAIYATRSVVVTLPTADVATETLTLSRATFTQLGRADEGVIPVLIEPLGDATLASEQPHRP